jgi:hypothetical protein
VYLKFVFHTVFSLSQMRTRMNLGSSEMWPLKWIMVNDIVIDVYIIESCVSSFIKICEWIQNINAKIDLIPFIWIELNQNRRIWGSHSGGCEDHYLLG